MALDPTFEAAEPPFDVGEYCRRVERHLTRVNQGQIVRVAGVAFDLVRTWALEGIPLSIVYQGIDNKAARHREGRSTRPLRLEFCEADVRALFADWQRAVGVWPREAGGVPTPAQEERRRPSATRQLDRAVDRMLAASGRADTDPEVAGLFTRILEDMVALRSELKRSRGSARAALAGRVSDIDRAIADAARRAAGPALAVVVADAVRELAAFRSRMAPDAWDRSVSAATDRLLRERAGLPHLDLALGDDSNDPS